MTSLHSIFTLSAGRYTAAAPGTPFPPLQTQGLAVYGSGTQFPSLQRGQRRLIPAQVNNCFSFPGMGKGCVASGVPRVSTGMLLAAAGAIAVLVSNEELGEESILPAIPRLQEVAEAVAAAVATAALAEARGDSSGGPVTALASPDDLRRRLDALRYVAAEVSLIPAAYC